MACDALEEVGIPFLPGECGLFIWVDFREVYTLNNTIYWIHCVIYLKIGYFTVVFLVAKPLIWSEAEGDHVVIETSISLVWWQSNLHVKSSNVCIIIRSTLASLLFKGLATKHATVKRTFGSCRAWMPAGSLENRNTYYCTVSLSFRYFQHHLLKMKCTC